MLELGYTFRDATGYSFKCLDGRSAVTLNTSPFGTFTLYTSPFTLSLRLHGDIAQHVRRLDHPPDHVVHFLLRVEPPQPEADRALRPVVAYAEGLEDVGRLARGRHARRAQRHSNVVHAYEQRLPVDTAEAHVQVMRQAVFHAAVDPNIVEARENSVPEPV